MRFKILPSTMLNGFGRRFAHNKPMEPCNQTRRRRNVGLNFWRWLRDIRIALLGTTLPLRFQEFIERVE